MTDSGKDVAKVVLVVILAVAFAIFVWPTAWTYHGTGLLVGEQLFPIASRVHRFTGRVEGLTITGWEGPTETAVAPTAPPVQPEPEMAPSAPTPTE